MARFKINTNAFSIAHYILLFFVTGLCICIIAWIMIARHNATPQNNVHTDLVTAPCIKRATYIVERMWENDPKSVPDKYWNAAIEYINEISTTRTYGLCQDVVFVCNPGQRKRDCDPCAIPNARAYAKNLQTIDMIQKNCKE